MKKCKICGENEATIPDRNKSWSRRKEICSECHGERLKNDLIDILIIEKNKREGQRF